jgi:hypothetical protein
VTDIESFDIGKTSPTRTCHGCLKVTLIESIISVPSKGTELPPLLYVSVKESQPAQELFPFLRLSYGRTALEICGGGRNRKRVRCRYWILYDEVRRDCAGGVRREEEGRAWVGLIGNIYKGLVHIFYLLP